MSKAEVSFPSSDLDCQLHGDLSLPSSNSADILPAIIIISGSGPIDRDGNAKKFSPFNTSNNFAKHMMTTRSPEHSIAVLSYDKRGIGKSTKVGDKNFYYRSGMYDLVKDAVEAVRYMQGHPRIDKEKIVLLGHSEGAIIMPLICGEIERIGLEQPIGAIFYAGFGENLVGAMKLQRQTIAKEVKEMPGIQGWLLRRLINEEKMDKQYADIVKKLNETDADYISKHCGFVKKEAKWYREHIAYDDSQVNLAKHMKCHCLAITGQKDFQVRNEFCEPETAKKLVPNAKSIESHQPVNLTHALRSMEGPAKMMKMKQDYAKMGKMPLDEKLLRITDAWLDRVLFDKKE